MSTKNTPEDLRFAEMYIDFVARKGMDPEARAKAKILQATITILDKRHPTWRAELLEELDRLDLTKTVDKMFPFPAIDHDKMFTDFMASILPRGEQDGHG
jgi:hypothetical protein